MKAIPYVTDMLQFSLLTCYMLQKKRRPLFNNIIWIFIRHLGRSKKQ